MVRDDVPHRLYPDKKTATFSKFSIITGEEKSTCTLPKRVNNVAFFQKTDG